jgi:hypothetical protein
MVSAARRSSTIGRRKREPRLPTHLDEIIARGRARATADCDRRTKSSATTSETARVIAADASALLAVVLGEPEAERLLARPVTGELAGPHPMASARAQISSRAA